MSEDSTSKGLDADKRRELANKLATVGWALFLIWVGIAFLANVGVGVGLLGVGVIILGAQAARKLCSLKLERLWVAIGLLFLVGGLGEATKLRLPLVPIVLVVAGLVMLFSAFRGKHPKSK